MIWLQHALMFLIVFVGPVREYFAFKRLKASTDPAAKVRAYRKLVIVQWVTSALVLLVVGRGIFWAPAKFAWMDATWARLAGAALAAGFTIAMLAPFFMLQSEKGRTTIRKAFGKLEFFLPTRAGQFGWFGVACVTAGICEEWVFRGFLFRYFGETPWHFGLVVAFVISTFLFGGNHFYQGWKGIISTGILGAGFGLLYLWSGSLLMPMVVHALVDLRALGLLKTVFGGDGAANGNSVATT